MTGHQKTYELFNSDARFVNLMLVILVVFPSVDFFTRYAFELLLLIPILIIVGINRSLFRPILLIFLYLILSSSIHFFISGSPDEIYDLIRIISPLLVFSIVYKKINNNSIETIFNWLILLNLIAIFYFEYIGDIFSLSQYMHSRGLVESYGRHSGIFTNVAVLGAFSTLSIIFNLGLIFQRNRPSLKGFFSIILSGYLVLESGSKTGMGLTLIFSTLMFFLYALKHRNFFSISMSSILIASFISILPFLIETYYQLEKLFMVFDLGLLGISSFTGRTIIWMNIFETYFSSNLYFLFGVPKAIIDEVSTTYDNDYIWIIARYGIFALLGYLLIIFTLILKYMKVAKYNNNFSANFWSLLLLCCYGLFIGVFTTPQLFVLACTVIAPVYNLNFMK